MLKFSKKDCSTLNTLLALLLVSFISYQSVVGLEYDSENLPLFQASFQSTNDDHEPAGLPVENSTRSFWLHPTSEVNPLARIGSTGPLSSDANVCIIGSGITGVSAAYHFSRLMQHYKAPEDWNLRVAIFEARDFCSGATGRNGGHLTPNAFKGFRRNARKYGVQEAIRQIAIEHYTVAELSAFVNNKDMNDYVDLVEGGHMDLHLFQEEAYEAREDFDAASKSGVNTSGVYFYDNKYMSENYFTNYPAVKIPGYNVWPLKLVTRLYQEAYETSLRLSHFSLNLHTNTPVLSVTSSSNSSRPWTLHTKRGIVNCQTVLHATNGYASHLLPHLSGPKGIVPTRGQIIGFRSNSSAKAVSRTGWGAGKDVNARRYWFPRPIKPLDNDTHPLIIIGGGKEVTGPDYERYETDDSVVRKDMTEVLRYFLPEVFPTLYPTDAKLEYEWTGILGYTEHDDPFVGPLSVNKDDRLKGQYISAGYSGHGMPRAYACAEAVVQIIHHEITGHDIRNWTIPAWLPRHYLTWDARNDNTSV